MFKQLIEKYGLRELIRFSITFIIYVIWVIWLGNYWFLFGIPIIIDIYLTKKVNWTPWKKTEGKNHWFIEWLDALIFAVVAVTIINIFLFQNYKIPTGSMEKSLLIGDHLYVSKVAYGPRIPHTPLSIPFMQHTIPGTENKSYVEWIKLPYKRLAGLRKIKRDDPIVFNFPAGDTVCRDPQLQSVSYYYLVRAEAERLKMLDQYAKQPLKTEEQYYALGREELWKKEDIIVRPVDRRDNYIKRCVAIAGDTLHIIDGVVYINGKRQKEIPGLQYDFAVSTNGRRLNQKKLMDMGINKDDIQYSANLAMLQVPLNDEMAEEISQNRLVSGIEPLIRQADYYDNKMFPHDARFPWNLDQFGPLYIPKEGATIDINLDNLPLYERIIGYYEGNKLEVKDSVIYINGESANQYTFNMNYYWMMGDNRHRSLDSRYWGYVPEDHIVGKPKFVWLSLNQDKNFPMNIRLRRMFMGIR
jgi:signal peptidase I